MWKRNGWNGKNGDAGYDKIQRRYGGYFTQGVKIRRFLTTSGNGRICKRLIILSTNFIYFVSIFSMFLFFSFPLSSQIFAHSVATFFSIFSAFFLWFLVSTSLFFIRFSLFLLLFVIFAFVGALTWAAP